MVFLLSVAYLNAQNAVKISSGNDSYIDPEIYSELGLLVFKPETAMYGFHIYVPLRVYLNLKVLRIF